MLTNFDFSRERIFTFRPAKPALLIAYQCSLYDAFFFPLLTLAMSTSTWTALRILWTLIVMLIRNRLTACNLCTRWRMLDYIVIRLPIWDLGLNWRSTLALCRSWLYPAGTTLFHWNLPHRFRSCPSACVRISQRCLQRRCRFSTSTDTEAFHFRWIWGWCLLWLWLICLTLVLLGARARTRTTLATGVFCCKQIRS